MSLILSDPFASLSSTSRVIQNAKEVSARRGSLIPNSSRDPTRRSSPGRDCFGGPRLSLVASMPSTAERNDASLMLWHDEGRRPASGERSCGDPPQPVACARLAGSAGLAGGAHGESGGSRPRCSIRVMGRALGLLQPGSEIRRVEPYIVSEAMVGYAAFACAGQQPGVRDAEQPARGLCIEQWGEAAELVCAGFAGAGARVGPPHESRSMRCSVGGWLVSVSRTKGIGRSPSRALVSRYRARGAACPSAAA